MKDLQSITDLFYKYENKFISNDIGTTDLESILGLISSLTYCKSFEIVIDLHDTSFIFNDMPKANEFISFINAYGFSKTKPTLSLYNEYDTVPTIVHFSNSYLRVDQDHLQFLETYISFFEYIDGFVRNGYHHHAPLYYWKDLTDSIMVSPDPNDVYRYAMGHLDKFNHLGVDFQNMIITHTSRLSHVLLKNFMDVSDIATESTQTSDVYELRVISTSEDLVDMTIKKYDIPILMTLAALIESGIIISDTKPLYYVL
ncbi:hypothetical protein D1872_36860 [compost metagenome]